MNLFAVIAFIIFGLGTLLGLLVLFAGVFLARMSLIISENLEDYRELEQEKEKKHEHANKN